MICVTLLLVYMILITGCVNNIENDKLPKKNENNSISDLIGIKKNTKIETINQDVFNVTKDPVDTQAAETNFDTPLLPEEEEKPSEDKLEVETEMNISLEPTFPAATEQPAPTEFIPLTPTFNVQSTLNKKIFKSGETMIFNVTVFATHFNEELYVELRGLEGRYGSYLKAREMMTLTNGTGNVIYSFKTPTCSPCSGVSQGNHTIDMKVTTFENEVVANETFLIELFKS